MSATKIGGNTTNILLLFFTINFHFATSNQISTYRKLNLPLKSSIYFVFLSLEMQNRLEQTKVCYALSYFVWKETIHKPLQVAAAKTLFSSAFVIVTTSFDECFLFYVITGKHYFSWKINVTLSFLWAPCYCFLWNQCSERSPYFMPYLHNNDMYDANTNWLKLIIFLNFPN